MNSSKNEQPIKGLFFTVPFICNKKSQQNKLSEYIAVINRKTKYDSTAVYRTVCTVM